MTKRNEQTKLPDLENTNLTISLTNFEQKLFNHLLAICKYYSLKTTIRVAGGWVRDKLLGRESNDIDLALDDMLGSAFGKYVNRYQTEVLKGKETTLAIIKSNPNLSKHLETTRMKIFGQWIDFTNLRNDDFAKGEEEVEGCTKEKNENKGKEEKKKQKQKEKETNREEEKEKEKESEEEEKNENNKTKKHTTSSTGQKIYLGDPKTDAHRRDLTINTLFYNIHSKSIEDFTGHGIHDLKNGIIRTPLPPLETFTDDPLRILRLIKYSTRYGFQIHEETAKSVNNEKLLHALRNNISKERIYGELQSILSSERPYLGFKKLCKLNIYSAIFYHRDYYQESFTQSTLKNLKKLKPLLSDIPKTRLPSVILGCLLLPYCKFVMKKKKNTIQMSNVILFQNLCFPKKLSNQVGLLHQGINQFIEILPTIEEISRSELGLIVRNYKESWLDIIVLCKIYSPHSGDFSKITQKINDFQLNDAWNLRPLLNGGDVKRILQIKKGPLIGQAIQAAFKHQLDFPNLNKKGIEEFIYNTLK
ncbi:cca tRNA nucleotidyltransferase [Anaeramoeba flamelloides]|uniref:Cca tRNA nucleotidyltransferase n=1 Tax=Anaeramoeba flamelloides TaxID=1746091 RepID=A0AAV7ZB95_9EUKA|nr:cca tRNA nucleotidyltransferase [Anaeramoeba flamelloides]